jgi:hypothetical protein
MTDTIIPFDNRKRVVVQLAACLAEIKALNTMGVGEFFLSGDARACALLARMTTPKPIEDSAPGREQAVRRFWGFIDPPDIGALVEKWRVFKREMERIEPRTPDIEMHLRMAKDQIERLTE